MIQRALFDTKAAIRYLLLPQFAVLGLWSLATWWSEFWAITGSTGPLDFCTNALTWGVGWCLLSLCVLLESLADKATSDARRAAKALSNASPEEALQIRADYYRRKATLATLRRARGVTLSIVLLIVVGSVSSFIGDAEVDLLAAIGSHYIDVASVLAFALSLWTPRQTIAWNVQEDLRFALGQRRPCDSGSHGILPT